MASNSLKSFQLASNSSKWLQAVSRPGFNWPPNGFKTWSPVWFGSMRVPTTEHLVWLVFGSQARKTPREEIWKNPCPIFVRSIAMEGGTGPVASSSHHSLYYRMPGVKIVSPMTPKELKHLSKSWFTSTQEPKRTLRKKLCASEFRPFETRQKGHQKLAASPQTLRAGFTSF